MALSEIETQIYQNVLKQIPDISLNLMAVKVEDHPEDFVGWCNELIDVCQNRINFDLLEPQQLPILSKLQKLFESGVSISQLKTLRIAPWPIIAESLKAQKDHLVLDEQLALLTYLAELKTQKLSEMIEEDKHAFVGKHTAKHDPSVYKFDVEWFASTKSAKSFHNLLNASSAGLDKALANIPLEGDVALEHYHAFITDYVEAFNVLEDEKATLAPATRLLAMRRPDVFTPVTAGTLDLLCQAFGIVRLNNRDFDRYWHEIVMTIQKFPWYLCDQPEDEFEQRIWQYRALIPCWFHYYATDAAQQSNYYRALHKPKRTSTSSAAPKRRGKESAEVLVDRALEAEDMPEHIKNMRDSIVSEVEKGRGVDETINLMRTIFG